MIEKHIKLFDTYKWNIKYEYIQKTYDLIFINNNNNNNTIDNDEKTNSIFAEYYCIIRYANHMEILINKFTEMFCTRNYGKQ